MPHGEAAINAEGGVLVQVATLTKHLQDTNEDLRQAQEAIERFEGESTVGSMAYGRGLLPALPRTKFEKVAEAPTSELPILAQTGAVLTCLQMMDVANGAVRSCCLSQVSLDAFWGNNSRHIFP